MISAEELFDRKLEKGRGYDKKEVDDYIQEIYEAYQELNRKNMEYQDQIQTLNSGLQHYKAIETSLQKALILAEKTADETIQTAKLKADSIIREAENRASVYTSDSKAELEAVHGRTIGLMQEYVRYKAQFNRLIQEQLELLNGSRFDIQTDDLLAFQKITDESVAATEAMQSADTIPLPTATEPAPQVEAPKVSFSDVEETDTSFESAIPETASSVEVFPGYKASGSINNLDYLNAAERLNEEAFNSESEE